jgi:hypothetical protein
VEHSETYEPLSEQKFTEIRRDLWQTMTLDQLVKQQELLLARMQKLSMMRSASVATIGGILQQGYQEISQMILEKTQQK